MNRGAGPPGGACRRAKAPSRTRPETLYAVSLLPRMNCAKNPRGSNSTLPTCLAQRARLSEDRQSGVPLSSGLCTSCNPYLCRGDRCADVAARLYAELGASLDQFPPGSIPCGAGTHVQLPAGIQRKRSITPQLRWARKTCGIVWEDGSKGRAVKQFHHRVLCQRRPAWAMETAPSLMEKYWAVDPVIRPRNSVPCSSAEITLKIFARDFGFLCRNGFWNCISTLTVVADPALVPACKACRCLRALRYFAGFAPCYPSPRLAPRRRKVSSPRCPAWARLFADDDYSFISFGLATKLSQLTFLMVRIPARQLL